VTQTIGTLPTSADALLSAVDRCKLVLNLVQQIVRLLGLG
jgi:hypothetical protein